MTMPETYTVGIVGAGMIADTHALALNAMDGVALGAVFARDSDKAAAFARSA